MRISVFVGDLCAAPAEAVCTSTNPRLSLVMGTGASLRERGGFGILRECEALRGDRELPPGSAHVTSAGKLPFRAAIHCVACDRTHRSSSHIVAACVRSALGKADELGVKSVAMPLFATGHARVKFDHAIEAMISAIRNARTDVQEVVIVVYDADRAEQIQRALTGPPHPTSQSSR
jgi:O-acetyl-ADP-ribose deacetylase (regulator of RNase III)